MNEWNGVEVAAYVIVTAFGLKSIPVLHIHQNESLQSQTQDYNRSSQLLLTLTQSSGYFTQTQMFIKSIYSLQLALNNGSINVRYFSSSNESVSNYSNKPEANNNLEDFNFYKTVSPYIFTNIEKILDTKPINKETQIEIERFLWLRRPRWKYNKRF